ncbi:MAG: 30S ribosomal protein S13 [Thermoplasmata archaeon]|nr:30S ribosomal protein S13 [Candidatus Thermoplasmatota archaeon]MCK4456135.1 30S ribosomal protein S13 [Thermoplasmata archaeon]
MATDSDKEDSEFKYIVRIMNTDLQGEKPVVVALPGVKGVGVRTAEIIVDQLELDRRARIGDLPDDKIEEIEKILKELPDVVPPWLLNRRKDLETGEDHHRIGPELGIGLRDDINMMRKIRCYRGIRHETGQKVRGQRTRSNGRSGLTVGVMKKAARLAMRQKKKE